MEEHTLTTLKGGVTVDRCTGCKGLWFDIGEAEALKDNPALIQLRIAEQWDGKLPQVSGGGAIPLLNLDSIGKKDPG